MNVSIDRVHDCYSNRIRFDDDHVPRYCLNDGGCVTIDEADGIGGYVAGVEADSPEGVDDAGCALVDWSIWCSEPEVFADVFDAGVGAVRIFHRGG